MSAPRGEFSSKLGFLMAAAGSAVGLGNIWGFPTQVASNGGAAFLLVYLVMAFGLAYPALMAELIIGRHTKSNAVRALQSIGGDGLAGRDGAMTGFAGILTACLILGFYGIVAEWLASQGVGRSLLFTAVFMVFTITIICGGVKEGIEKWCSRLMPTLLIIMLALIFYVFTLDGAMDGARAYLVPDFGRITNPNLIISAMGQAFFSLSLGVGTMLIYGSYVSDSENLESLGRYVTLLDVCIAVVAGLLIIPALFETMGGAGLMVSLAIFVLLSLAALTSTVSMLEVPVAYAVESHGLQRRRATILIGTAIAIFSGIVIFNMQAIFGLVVVVATQYGEPLVGLMMCVFAGWIFHRNSLLQEIQKGHEGAEHGLFWKIWPGYVRFVCPAAIAIIFLQKFLS